VAAQLDPASWWQLPPALAPSLAAEGAAEGVAGYPGVDAALCTFVVSALHPDLHLQALQNIRNVLKPGGILCFRDYAMFDLAQLRAPDSHVLSEQLHLRPDGTFAYYFQAEELRALLLRAGFTVDELTYCTVININRRKNQEMKRIFVHALCHRAR
jgi:methyltransferase-like protein 6